MTPKKKPPQDLWDAEFQHWHVLGPVLWAIVAYIGAAVLHMLDVSALPVVLVGVGVSALAPLTAVYKRFTFLLMAATTGLLTWTTATTPWQRPAATAAAAGGALFGVAYQALRSREAKVADADQVAQTAATKGKYVELLETVGVRGLKEGRARVPFPTGKTVVLLLPVSGKVTLTRLKDATEALEIAAARAGLSETYEFERGANAAEVLLHVFDRDVLSEDVPLPFERGPKSIHEPIPLGQYATGEICVVTYREVAALMIGLKGRGKSALINTHLAHLTGCTDAVVWLLDGKQGETVRPWLQPFLNLVTTRPAINWAAIDADEFDAVLLAAKAAIEYRAPLPGKTGPTAALPSIIVIVEEASVITGVGRYGGANRSQLAQDGVTQGRSSYVDWLLATQRATVTMVGSGDMKSNLDLRYGLGILEEQDARMIFPNGQLAKTLYKFGDEQYQGVFLMQGKGTNRVMPAKGYWLDQSVIPSVAESNAQWVAELDHGTAEHIHRRLTDAGVPGGYYGRWDRLCAKLGCDTPSQVTRATASSRPTDTPRPVDRPTETSDTGRASKAVQDAIAASRAKRDDETFRSLWEANFDDTAEAETLQDTGTIPEGVPPILRCMLAVFKGRGNPEALPTKLILAEPVFGGMSPHVLGRLMALCNVAPGENVIWEGKRHRGYTRDDLETSAKRGTWTSGADQWRP